ncbi:MAG TPA: c-type cytochrome domain-containing protein [Gemmataceae bacterium]
MRQPRFCLCILCAVLASIAAALILLGSPATARAQNKPVSFIEDVAPVLKENCFACHDAKKRSGKYDMTTFETLLAGGASAEAIVPGKPDESELYYLISAEDEERRMPPKGKGDPLPKEKVELIKRWIEQGAKPDAGIDPKGDLVAALRARWKPPAPPDSYRFPTIVNALAFTPDGERLVAGGHHELTVWDLATGKLRKRVHTRSERAYAMAFLPDGKLAVAGGRPGQEGDVRVYDLGAPGKEENEVTVLDGVGDPKVLVKQLAQADDSVLCLALSKDGKKLAAGGCDRVVRVWDVSGGAAAAKLKGEIENHADWVLGVAFSDDGKLLFTAGRDKTAKVWDLAAKESVLTFPGHQEPVFDVAVKADGKVGYSVGADKQLRFWNASGDGKQVRNVGGHGGEIYKLLRHPKEKLLITCSADKTVRVWNEDNGRAVRTLSGLNDYVYALAVSPDGTRVAAGAYDGEVKVWALSDGKLVKEFNASPGYVARK